MKSGLIFFLSVMLILTMGGCRVPDIPGFPAISPTLTATPEPQFVLGPGATSLIDDFEAPATHWVADTSSRIGGSSATRVSTSTQHPTRGSQSLQLSFHFTNPPRAVFILEREFDLGNAQAVAFDVFNPDGDATAAALVFQHGEDGGWQESYRFTLKPGPNALRFELTGTAFSSLSGVGPYNQALASPAAVRRMGIVIYPSKTGSVYVDRLVAIRAQPLNTSITASTAASPHLMIRSTPSSLEQYSLLELDLETDIVVDNPFNPDQISIDVKFNSPSGEHYSIPAFFYQDFTAPDQKPVWPQTWKARFTPWQEGEWTAQAEIRAGTLNVLSQLITFTATPSVSRGFVRVDSTNPEYLMFDNAESFFPVGINLGWGHADPLADYARWFDQLKQNGANVTRIWMASWSFGIEWKDSGLGRYRLDRAWLLDKVLHMAEERGIYVILVLINHGAFNIRVNPEWADNPYNAELGGPCVLPDDFASNPQALKLFKQRLRYIAARWSYSPNLLAWEWWNEVNFTPLGDPNLLRPWLKEMTSYLHSVDPYRHLTSISYGNSPDPRIVSMPELDTYQYHAYSSLDARSVMADAYKDTTAYGTKKLDKPVLFTEFGASASSEQPGRFDEEGVQFHNGLWASTFNGFASAAMYWWWDSYIEPNNYWIHLKGLSSFLADQDLATLRPTATQVNTSTVQALALGSIDRALIWLRNNQYSPDAAVDSYRKATLFEGVKEADWRMQLQKRANVAVTISGLQPGQYHVGWFDTRTGESIVTSDVSTQGGSLTLDAPTFDRDLAAKLMWFAN